jgi:thiol-disulfide isomerase/thioredoxin
VPLPSVRRGVAALGCAVALSAVAACGGSSAVGASGVREWAPGDRPAAPQLSGTTLAGAAYDTAADRGKVLVVNFWASWCPPCRDEAPALRQIYADTKAKGVRFLGVDVRDERTQARTFTRAHGIGYPSLFDPSSETVLAFRHPVLPTSPPTTLVIDRAGKVAAMFVGEARYTVLAPVVRRVAAEPSAQGST